MAGDDLENILNSFSPVTLGEIDNVRLMNRTDTKFIFPANVISALLADLAASYRILEIDNRRSFPYITKYLDTEELLFYIHHVTGKLARFKIRFREYRSTGTTFLEIKKRDNKNRTIKWRIENDFRNGELDENAKAFIKKHIPFNSFELLPSLENRFTRITLAGIHANERLTIDSLMSFSVENGAGIDLPYLAVAELKSDGYPSSSPFLHCTRRLKIMPTGFSKYCIGNALLKEIPKKNMLKQKLLSLNKIKNEYSKFLFT